ncbi:MULTISPECIES: NAD(P)-dependent alcohol dehydrogenase [unclassified Gordonia (in: high G+C Gram-positive bacteria)]|uniref:NAD(P)-dependent alcohol dehydrogenase n=1 Tax=unclassified Gordonia (in: high G+C Gram-positive bacteria) TaxID=2657482 RepID=UPI0009AE2AFA|nr:MULTISPECIES: NAD(P)-dependent alcohol dehydrogenase [unclassified Gordonia (in: high G+C Gram-positive bacteria)]MDF3281127.1 NAD(P)-dependent alcohol dehydrogenase [Gordonia sp. N1V]OPX06130.1 alcohol dehydrogenase [Gordonia sp. i37]
MKTTAAILTEANAPLELVDVDVAPLRSDEVLVRIVGVGVCHTDLGVIAAPAPGQTPIVLGHEGSGIVEEVGNGVTELAVGDRVVLSYAHCNTCDHCAGGIPQHCRQFIPLNLVGARADGSSPLSRDGDAVLGAWFGQSSWARHAVVAAHNTVKVDDDLPLELLGPLGCGIQTGAGAVLNSLSPEPGSSIAVFAVGSVGLAAVLAAVAAGCTTIIAVDISDDRLATAAELGATHTINSSSVDPAERIREITGGTGTRYSVDCIGFESVLRSALECLDTPGTCATVGFQGLPNEVAIDQGHLLFGKTLVGVIEGDAVPREFVPRMIELYRNGRFPFDKLITTYDFAAINDAIDAVHHGKVTKAVLTFG